jgi:uncharacterized protein
LNQLIVFAKAPRPGLVKTRLAKVLGSEGASSACKVLLQTVGANLESISAAIQYWPQDAATELKPFFPSHWQCAPQTGADLGERLSHAFQNSFSAGAKKVAIIGSDCPFVLAQDIEAAWSALEHVDAVFGPATDGGYWLVGMARFLPELFRGIDWSSEHVLRQSVARAHEIGVKHALLRELSDIDTAADWEQFQRPVRV